jgi:hypothetical protein
MPVLEKGSNLPVEVINSNELKVIYSWQSPSRSFKKRNKNFWVNILSILFLIGLILILAGGQFMLLAVLISLTFLYYVFSTVEPELTEHKITNRGFVYFGQNYPWETIKQFWISEKNGVKVLNLELITQNFIKRISPLIGNGDVSKIRETLIKFVVEEEATPNFMDKSSDWLVKKIPLDLEAKQIAPVEKVLHKPSK